MNLLFLSFFSIFIGYFLKDMMVGFGTDFWGNSILNLPENALLFEAEFLDTSVKLTPVIFSLIGGFSSFVLYNFYFKVLYFLKVNVFKNIYIFLNRKWFFDKIYNELFSQQILIYSYTQAYQFLDRGLFEILGPQGIYYSLSKLSKKYLALNSFLAHGRKYYNKVVFNELFMFILMVASSIHLAFNTVQCI